VSAASGGRGHLALCAGIGGAAGLAAGLSAPGIGGGGTAAVAFVYATQGLAGALLGRALEAPDAPHAATERLARALLLGPLALTIQMLCFAALGLPFGVASLTLPWWLIAGAVTWRANRDAQAAGRPAPRPPGGGARTAVIVLAGVLVVSSLVVGLQMPVHTGDAMNNYAVNARVFETQRGLAPETLAALAVPGHTENPPLVALNEALIFLAAGPARAWAIKPFFTLAYAALLLLVIEACFRELDARHAVPVALLAMLTPIWASQASDGYADLRLTAGVLLLALEGRALWRARATRALPAFIAAALVCAATKHEGVALAGLACGLPLLAAVRRRLRPRAATAAIVATLALALAWPLYAARTASMPLPLMEPLWHDVGRALGRLPEVVARMAALTLDTLAARRPRRRVRPDAALPPHRRARVAGGLRPPRRPLRRGVRAHAGGPGLARAHRRHAPGRARLALGAAGGRGGTAPAGRHRWPDRGGGGRSVGRHARPLILRRVTRPVRAALHPARIAGHADRLDVRRRELAMTAARIACLGLVLICCTGSPGSCVDFDGQTVVTRVDVDKDRLDMLIVYRDLHTTEPDTAGALAQLETLRADERWIAFFSNWPFMMHVEAMLDDAEPEEPAYAALLAAMGERIEVRPGPLWIDETGRLCGRQLLRVTGLADLIDRINAAIREDWADAEERADAFDEFDEESLALLGTAVERGHDFVSLRGSALAFTLPISDAGFIEMKRRVLREALKEASDAWGRPPEESGKRREMDAALEFLAVNEWSVERSDGYVTFVLGNPHADRWTMEVPPVGRNKRHGTLLPALRDAGWTLLGPEEEQAASVEFEAFVVED
jgi:hypothetical protein